MQEFLGKAKPQSLGYIRNKTKKIGKIARQDIKWTRSSFNCLSEECVLQTIKELQILVILMERCKMNFALKKDSCSNSGGWELDLEGGH